MVKVQHPLLKPKKGSPLVSAKQRGAKDTYIVRVRKFRSKRKEKRLKKF